jgi:hypothetical protein
VHRFLRPEAVSQVSGLALEDVRVTLALAVDERGGGPHGHGRQLLGFGLGWLLSLGLLHKVDRLCKFTYSQS